MRWLALGILFIGCGGAEQVLTGNDASTDGSVQGDVASGDTGVPGDGGVIPDGGGPPVLPCGTGTCVGGQVCCVDTTVQPTTYTCAAMCPTQTTALKCNGNDCGPNLVCCVSQTMGVGVASACMASCPNGSAQLCQASDAGAPTGCAADAGCSSRNIGDWGLMPPFGTCGGVGN